jgi:hypothetical protein
VGFTEGKVECKDWRMGGAYSGMRIRDGSRGSSGFSAAVALLTMVSLEDVNTRDWKRSSAIESFNDISELRWIFLFRSIHDENTGIPKDVADDANSSRSELIQHAIAK